MLLLHLGDQHLPKAVSVWDFFKRWELDPFVIAILVCIGLVYVVGLRRMKSKSVTEIVPPANVFMFVSGFIVLALALISPISAYADDLFFVHMIQHLLLMLVAAPLFLLSNSMPVVLWSMPKSLRHGVGELFVRNGVARRILEWLTKPRFALIIYVLVIGIWHVPVAFDAALEHVQLHYFEHITFFIAGLVFWWPVIGPAPLKSQASYPARMLYLFLASLLMVVLAIVLTFSHGSYSFYIDAPGHWGISMALDQQLGGLIMWVPGNFIFLSALTALFFAWAGREERETEHWKKVEQKRSRYMAGLGKN